MSDDGREIANPSALFEASAVVCARVLGCDVAALRRYRTDRTSIAAGLSAVENHFSASAVRAKRPPTAPFCGEHARQIARAYLFTADWLLEETPPMLTKLQKTEFYALGTLTGTAPWVPAGVSLLLAGQARRWWGGLKTRECVSSLRSIAKAVRMVVETAELPLYGHPLAAQEAWRVQALTGIDLPVNRGKVLAEDVARVLARSFADARKNRTDAEYLIERLSAAGGRSTRTPAIEAA